MLQCIVIACKDLTHDLFQLKLIDGKTGFRLSKGLIGSRIVCLKVRPGVARVLHCSAQLWLGRQRNVVRMPLKDK